MTTIGSSDQVTHTTGPNNPLNSSAPANVKEALENTAAYFSIWGVLFADHQSQMNALDGRIDTLEAFKVSTEAVDADARLTALEAVDSNTRLVALEAAVASLTTRVTTAETALYTHGLQILDLQSTTPRFVVWTGTAYPSRPTTNGPVLYLDGPGPDGTNHTGTAPDPTKGDLHVQRIPS